MRVHRARWYGLKAHGAQPGGPQSEMVQPDGPQGEVVQPEGPHAGQGGTACMRVRRTRQYSLRVHRVRWYYWYN